MKIVIFVVIVLAFNFGTIFAFEGVEIKRISINENARYVSRYDIWKEFEFEMPIAGYAKITVIANARIRDELIYDSLKWGINNEDFGWGTEKSWLGNILKGESKTIEVQKYLEAGTHKIKFWADNNPMLEFILIEIDAEIFKKKPYLTSVNQIENLGVKIDWYTEEKISKFNIYRKTEFEEKFNIIGTVDIPSFIDLNIDYEKNYIYKIASLGTDEEILGFSDPFLNERISLEVDNTDSIPVLKDQIILNYHILNEFVNIKWNDDLSDNEFFSYTVYRKLKHEVDYEKIGISHRSQYKDTSSETNKIYLYKVGILNNNGNETFFSEEIVAIANKHNPTGTVSIYPEIFYPGTKVTIYFKPSYYEALKKYDEKIFLQIKHNDIKKRKKLETDFILMKYDIKTSYWKIEFEIPNRTTEITVSFYDEKKHTLSNSSGYSFNTTREMNPPKPPENIVIERQDGLIKISWDLLEENDIKEYNILRSDYKDKGFDTINSLVGRVYSDNNFIDKSIVNSRSYYYKIRAIDYHENVGESTQIFKVAPYQQ